jgi:hypothetical protein
MRIRSASRLAAGSPLAIGVTLWASATFFGSGAAARGPAGEPADPLPSRRIDRLVAGDGRLFALRGGEIVTFDWAGQQLGRCSAFAAPPAHGNRAELGAPDAEEVLQAAGLPDDDSTQDAEDALDDEGLGTKRQARPLPSPGIEPRALSAAPGAAFAWVATSSGVFRGNENGCAPAGLSGRDLVAVAADDGIVLAASEDLLFRREAGGGAQDDDPSDDEDGGATFTVAAGLTSRPRALAVGPAGEAIVADDDGVSIIGRDDTATRILDRPTDAIAVCDGVTAVLSTDGVYAWRPGTAVARLGDRPPARALACGPIPDQRWIATGLGVWTSADGATWVERSELMGRSVAAAAFTGEQIWLAVDNALHALDPNGDPREAWSAGASRPIGDLSGGGWATLSTRRLRAPLIPWPWVTAMLTSDRTPDRHAWSAMVLLTFPLGRAGSRPVDPSALASELVRRDVALAAEEIDLLAAPPDDEVDARLAAIRREREALR